MLSSIEQPALLTVHSVMQVRWADLDAYGHVNHTRILAFFEEGRFALLAHVQAQGTAAFGENSAEPMIVVAESHVRYLRALNYPAEIHLQTLLLEVRGARLRFQASLRQGDENIAENETLAVWLNPANGKPCRVGSAFMQALSRAAHQMSSEA